MWQKKLGSSPRGDALRSSLPGPRRNTPPKNAIRPFFQRTRPIIGIIMVRPDRKVCHCEKFVFAFFARVHEHPSPPPLSTPPFCSIRSIRAVRFFTSPFVPLEEGVHKAVKVFRRSKGPCQRTSAGSCGPSSPRSGVPVPESFRTRTFTAPRADTRGCSAKM